MCLSIYLHNISENQYIRLRLTTSEHPANTLSSGLLVNVSITGNSDIVSVILLHYQYQYCRYFYK